MKIGWVTMEKVSNRRLNSVGTSRIRARWLINYWPEAEEWQIGGKYDVLIFQKAWFEMLVEQFKGIKIFDIADPEWLDTPKPFFKIMSACDAVTASTKALADYVSKFLSIPVVHVPDRVDLAEHEQYKDKRYSKGEAKNCVWFGYSHNFHYVEKTLKHLMKLNLQLTVIANKSMTTVGDYASLRIKNVGYNYRTVHDEIIKHDICLLPSPTDQDFKGRFKSNNKDLTAMALGMPIARLPEDLRRLMNPVAREKEGRAGRKEVEEKWDVRLSVKQYQELINDIKSRKKK